MFNLREVSNIQSYQGWIVSCIHVICYISVPSEFDSWYNDSFVQGDEVKTSAEVGIGARAGTQQPAGQAKATTVVSYYQCII